MPDDCGTDGGDSGRNNGSSATGTDNVTNSGNNCQEPVSAAATGASPVDGGEDEKAKEASTPEGMVKLEIGNTEQAMVHFEENSATTTDTRPEPTTIFGKIYRCWDCDLVWVGVLLLATVAAFTMFITFIALSATTDKEILEQRKKANL